MHFSQFAMMVIKTGDSFAEVDENIFNILLEMREMILPYEWHSFCISIDPGKRMVKLYHNDKIQAEQEFTITDGVEKGLFKLMTKGQVGGQKFVGYLTDLQIFRGVLSDMDIFGWTGCQVQVRLIILIFY